MRFLHALRLVEMTKNTVIANPLWVKQSA